MKRLLGRDCKLYMNTGSYGTPVWNPIDNVKDLALNLPRGEHDSSTRGSGEYDEVLRTNIKAAVEFDIPWDLDDTDFTALLAAFLPGGADKEYLVMLGDVTVPGTQGLRATMTILKFDLPQKREAGVDVPVSMKPASSAHPAAWFTAA